MKKLILTTLAIALLGGCLPDNNGSSGSDGVFVVETPATAAACTDACANIVAVCGESDAGCEAECQDEASSAEAQCVINASTCAAVEACVESQERDDTVTAGSNNGSSDGSDGSTGDTINGWAVDDYYAQFYWEADSQYHVGAAAFPEQTNGANTFLIQLFLKQNGDAHIFYEEGEGEVSFNGYSINTFSSTMKRIDTTWSIDGTSLLVGNQLSCGGMQKNGYEVLNCELLIALGSEAAVGQIATLDTTRQGSLSDSAFVDYSN